MRKLWSCIALSVSAMGLFTASSANAVIVDVTFDFTGGPNGDTATAVYTDPANGVTLTISPGYFTLTPTTIYAGDKVTRSGAGLGVQATPSNAEPQIESKQDLNELAIFSFDKTVQLSEIAFGAVDSTGGTSETMRYFVDSNNDSALDDFGTNQAIKNPPDNVLDLLVTYALANVTGKLFGFGAFFGTGTNNEWYITSLKFSYDNGECDPEDPNCGGPGPGPVPVPGALPLMMTGIAGLGYLARRRQKSTRS